MSKKATLTIQRLDHLGMVAQFIDELGIDDLIDKILGIQPNYILFTGQVLISMVLTDLGFTLRPLYLSAQFFTCRSMRQLLGGILVSVSNNSYHVSRFREHMLVMH